MKIYRALAIMFRLLLACAIGGLTVANASMSHMNMQSNPVVKNASKHMHQHTAKDVDSSAHCQQQEDDCFDLNVSSHHAGCADCQTLHCQSLNCTLIEYQPMSALLFNSYDPVLAQDLTTSSLLTGYWQQILRPPKS